MPRRTGFLSGRSYPTSIRSYFQRCVFQDMTRYTRRNRVFGLGDLHHNLARAGRTGHYCYSGTVISYTTCTTQASKEYL